MDTNIFKHLDLQTLQYILNRGFVLLIKQSVQVSQQCHKMILTCRSHFYERLDISHTFF